MGRAKVFKEQVKVSNSFFVTKLYVNDPIEEIQEFKRRLMNINNPIFSISHVSNPRSTTLLEELESPKFSLKPLEHLYANDAAGSFWVCARIFGVSDEWWYISCTRCTKKLHPAVDQLYYIKCDHLQETGRIRYMIHFQVVDESASATLLCWDRECEQLIGRPCADLRDESVKKESGSDSPVELPAELQGLIGKMVLFKVQIKEEQLRNYAGAFSVVKLAADQDLVWKYGATSLESQESDYLSKLQGEELRRENELDDSSSGDEVNTPSKLLGKRDWNDVSPLAKRTLNEQFSSSSTSMKMKSVIKKE